MVDLSKNHERWIKGFTKDQFDILVKSVIEVYWGVKPVVFTDGSGDGGIDVKVFENKVQCKIPIQVTVDGKIVPKLKSDLKTIHETIANYNYSNDLLYFCSCSPKEKTKDDLIKYARQEYGINLSFFDAKKIGAIAEDPDYIEVRKTIRSLLGDFIENDKLEFNQYDRMKFDLLVHGGDVTEIKNNIIRGFILNNLFNDGEVEQEHLFNKIEEYFGNIDFEFFKRQINWLRTNKKVLVKDKKLVLNEEERGRIQIINEGIEFQEQYFVYEIKSLLRDYNIDANYKDVIQEIINIYKLSYKKDLAEIKENADENSFEMNAICSLRNYLSEKINDDEKCSKVIKDIIEICEYNDYLQRISAGEVFSDLTNLPQIQNYIRRQPKPVFLDTSVLLHLLCLFIQDTSTSDNVFYNTVRDLYNYQNQGQIKLIFKTSEQYIREAAFQLLNAYRLIPFSKLDWFSDLGGTANIFYLHYRHLYEHDELEYGIESYEDFFYQLELEIENDINDDSLLDYISEFIEELLVSNNIEVVSVSQYEFNSKKQFEDIKELFERHHLSKEDNRPEITVKNDSLIFCELFSYDRSEIEPTILTWDSSFYEVRKNYHQKHRNLCFWHLFRPSKFLDHLSLIKFELNPKALSKDILSIIEADFNIQDKVKSLNDVMVRIVNLEHKSGLKLTKEVAALCSKHVYQLQNKDSLVSEKITKIPIEKVITDLSSYYRNREGDYDVEKFKLLLSKEEVVQEIVDLWKIEAEKIEKGNYSEQKVCKRMDELIKRSIED